jgi:hypothetical protein
VIANPLSRNNSLERPLSKLEGKKAPYPHPPTSPIASKSVFSCRNKEKALEKYYQEVNMSVDS